MHQHTPLPAPDIQTVLQYAGGAAWRLDLLHANDHDLLIWITRGQGRAIIEGQRRGIGAHNAVFIPSGTLHALEMGPQSFGLALRLPDGAELGFGRMVRHLRIRDQQAQADLTALLESMQREAARKAALQDRAMRAYGQLVAVWMHRQEIEPAPNAEPAAQRLVAAYCDLLVRRHRSGDTMSDLAEALDVSPTHLSRSCKQLCGLTAAEMQTQVSLYAARDLIEGSDVPLSRIADHLGFGSAAYFSRFIAQHTGHNPSALRRTKSPLTKKG